MFLKFLVHVIVLSCTPSCAYRLVNKVSQMSKSIIHPSINLITQIIIISSIFFSIIWNHKTLPSNIDEKIFVSWGFKNKQKRKGLQDWIWLVDICVQTYYNELWWRQVGNFCSPKCWINATFFTSKGPR